MELVSREAFEALVRRVGDLQAEIDRLRTAHEAPRWIAYTPTYYGGTTAGVTTYSADGQVGRYCRIGPVAIVRGRVSWTAATGTGEARISLPFTAANITNANAAFALLPNAMTFGGSTALFAVVRANENFLVLRGASDGAAASIVLVEPAGDLNFTSVYETQ